MLDLFFVLGLTILIGYFALALFERTRISQVLILIVFGILLGPVTHVVDTSPSSIIVSIIPFVSTITLIVLLFDAGLTIDIFSVARSIPRSTVFTLLVFFLTMIFVGALTVAALGWTIMEGLLFGSVVGGTSFAIVTAMVEKMNLSHDAKSILTVEATMTDALCIIFAVLIIHLILADIPPTLSSIAIQLIDAFSIPLVVGTIGAVLWIAIVTYFSVSRYSYMLTLAMIFGLYSLTQNLQGNGGFSVFIFGMILGNSRELGAMLKIGRGFSVSPMVSFFQEEMTFFVRTFFFVYIGLFLSPSYFSLPILGIVAAILALFILVRWAARKAVLPALAPADRAAVVTMLPRGLAPAVLAYLPLSMGLVIPNFQEMVFSTILLSNVAGTAIVFLIERRYKGSAAGPRPGGEQEVKASGPPDANAG